jgi:hypothetical protein
MAHGDRKDQSRENRARVRELLMREWDPIGVSGIPQAADEYDNYIDEVYMMLMERRASCETMAAYLFDIATNYMGISAHAELAERSARAASALVALRPEFEIH